MNFILAAFLFWPIVLMAQEREIAIILPGDVPLYMIWIAPGSFTMGTEPGQERGVRPSQNETPSHPVTLSKGYYLGQYEITQDQWLNVMNTSPWETGDEEFISEGPLYPAVQITWHQAVEFIEELNAQAGTALFRLPTEAEWEYAARAGSTTGWTGVDSHVLTENFAWYLSLHNGKNESRRVGTRWANAWGLYDMSGNVAEWVQDTYSVGYYQQVAQGVTDPLWEAEGTEGILRGGHSSSPPNEVRPAFRQPQSKDQSNRRIGFRIVMEDPADLGVNLDIRTAASGLALGEVAYRDVVGIEDLVVIAGTGEAGFTADGVPANQAQIINPYDVGVDAAGRVYFTEPGSRRVRQIDLDGRLITAAGGADDPQQDLTPAQQTELSPTWNIKVEPEGAFYFSDFFLDANDRVRGVSVHGQIITLAGNGIQGGRGDGGLAVESELHNPSGMHEDRAGNLFFADWGNHRIRRIGVDRTILTLAGTGVPGFSGDGGHVSRAQLNGPRDVFVDRRGNVYILDSLNNRVRKVDVRGTITTVIDFFNQSFHQPLVAAALGLLSPVSFYVHEELGLFVADTFNGRIVRVDWRTGEATVLLEDLALPTGITIDESDRLYVVEFEANRILRGQLLDALPPDTFPPELVHSYPSDSAPVDPRHLAAAFVGPQFVFDEPLDTQKLVIEIQVDGQTQTWDLTWSQDNDGLRLKAPEQLPYDALCSIRLGQPTDLAGNSAADILLEFRTISEPQELGTVEIIAGTGVHGMGGSGDVNLFGPATESHIGTGGGIFARADGSLFFVAASQHRVYKIDPYGVITAVAGNGRAGFAGDGEAAIEAELNFPQDVFVDGAGHIFIADEDNHRIRMVDRDGIITTVAGSGPVGLDGGGFGGDGGLAVEAHLYYPQGVFIDAEGVLYIADKFNHRIRKVDRDGIISTIAGNGIKGFSGDGGLAQQACLYRPSDIFVTDQGILYIADKFNHRIRKIDAAGVISTVAGSGPSGMNRALEIGGFANNNNLHLVYNLFAGCDNSSGTGCLYYMSRDGDSLYGVTFLKTHKFPDVQHSKVGDLDSEGVFKFNIIAPFESGFDPSRFSGDGGPAVQAQLNTPERVFVDAAGSIFVADWHNYRVRRIDAQGNIATVLGTGLLPTENTVDPSTQISIGPPNGLFVDRRGHILVSDLYGHRLRSLAEVAVPTTLNIGVWGTSHGPADLVPPVWLADNLPDQAEAVEPMLLRESGIRLAFSEPILLAESDIALIHGADSVLCSHYLAEGDSTLVVAIEEATPLVWNGEYRLQVKRITDRSGNYSLPVELTFFTARRSGDFNSDGLVNLSDFFLLAEQFALAARGEAWDTAFDMDRDGALRLSDFFIFVDGFGVEERAKLLALAQQYIDLPVKADLQANFPNPFNRSTVLPYALPQRGRVKISIYNTLGQMVDVLVDQEQPAGRYQAIWNGQDQWGGALASGVYLARFQFGHTKLIRHITILK